MYGALLDAKLRRRLLGREVCGEPAQLSGYAKGRKRYFFIVPRAGASVTGEILSELLPDDFVVLDRYEDTPLLYTRELAEVRKLAGEQVSCWVYLPTGWERR